MRIRWALLIAVLLSASRALGFDEPTKAPTPSDYSLVKWDRVVKFFTAIDQESDRIVVRELGRTTEDRPYLAAFISSADTIRDLKRYQEMQKKIALAEGGDVQELIPKSKAVVIITCSIHSNETASTFMAMKLADELAHGDDAETKEILDKTIVLLVPSANPDGIDIVADWYERTKGKPWEGSGMPRLYHKYAGHDTNRDWFMLNLKETQLLTHLLYKEWFPTLAYDVHQMGSRGARMFVPPFYDPINPNLDPRIHQSIATIGSHMASDLAAHGKRGVLTHAMYDNWWNGGNRTTPQRHNIVAVLTEAASVRLATPVFIDKDDLQLKTRGQADGRPAINFVDPWPGGWWRLADIEEYERICARSLLTLAARYKDRFQSDYLAMARTAIEKGKTEPPFGWVVPMNGPDPGRAADMVRILHDSGIRVHKAESEFKDGGITHPAGSYVMLADQPYRSHLKDMMERQIYPERFTATGEAEPPYDVAGWTLPLQMGVQAIPLNHPAGAGLTLVDRVERPGGKIEGDRSTAKTYMLVNQSNDDFILLNELLAAGIDVVRNNVAPIPAQQIAQYRPAARRELLLQSALAIPDLEFGALMFPVDPKSDAVLERVLPKTSTRIRVSPVSLPDPVPDRNATVLRKGRIGVYQPWVSSMDEGWTRLILERFHVPFETIHNEDIRAGNLSDRIDILLFPSIDAKTIREGYAAEQTEPRYVGGLGKEGAAALRKFLQHGQSIVFLEESCNYAIDDLGTPATNIVKGLKTSEFYGPGSIVGLINAPASAQNTLTFGVPAESSAYFDRSLAFDFPNATHPLIVSSYAWKDTLQSGWLHGASKIAGKPAIAELNFEGGKVVLFGFPPQHRGQPHGSFRLLLNALYR